MGGSGLKEGRGMDVVKKPRICGNGRVPQPFFRREIGL